MCSFFDVLNFTVMFFRGFDKQSWNQDLIVQVKMKNGQAYFSNWLIKQPNGCHRSGIFGVFGQIQIKQSNVFKKSQKKFPKKFRRSKYQKSSKGKQLPRTTKAYSEPCKTFMMESFLNIVNG